MSLETVSVVACGAVHDEMAGGFRAHELKTCALNAGCSHGNIKVMTALSQAVKAKKISKAESRAHFDDLLEASTGLRQIDVLSLNRRMLREGETTKDVRAEIEAALGNDETLWDQNLKALQLKLMEPVFTVMHKLDALGVIAFDSTVHEIDSRAIVEASYKT